MKGDREPVETPGVEHVEVLDVDEQVRELSAALAEGGPVPAGRLLGLPELGGDDVWVDIAGAAALAVVAPRTITSWLSRRGPRRNPFPTPHRYLYRLYWPRSTITAWLKAENHRATDARGVGP